MHQFRVLLGRRADRSVGGRLRQCGPHPRRPNTPGRSAVPLPRRSPTCTFSGGDCWSRRMTDQLAHRRRSPLSPPRPLRCRRRGRNPRGRCLRTSGRGTLQRCGQSLHNEHRQELPPNRQCWPPRQALQPAALLPASLHLLLLLLRQGPFLLWHPPDLPSRRRASLRRCPLQCQAPPWAPPSSSRRCCHLQLLLLLLLKAEAFETDCGCWCSWHCQCRQPRRGRQSHRKGSLHRRLRSQCSQH
mmetsp:Transcript_40035/g.85764  ORF Transcript_40035/g.85764 Transcript_40035/m.85764 type:complete len:243 (-) Transcript_40035:1474-2202(-)